MRLGLFNVGFIRSGPGLLLRDIQSGEDPQVLAAQARILEIRPDILVLAGFDYDSDKVALRAFAEQLKAAGLSYPYLFARPPNTGIPTGLDLDHDGRTGQARDAQGFGRFFGQGGMAILSRFAFDDLHARSFSEMLWKDLPGATLPVWAHTGVDTQAAAVLRLSSVAHWDVPVILPGGKALHLLAYHATTPVFDGPEDRNGLRNADENRFWRAYLDGRLPWQPPRQPFVIIGVANLDPFDGEGRHEAIRSLLNDPRVQDARPRGAAQAHAQGGINAGQKGDPALDTADWPDEDGPGDLRVDYILPAAGMKVMGSGLSWPPPAARKLGLNHALVWLDLGR